MERQHVRSSDLRSVGYDKESQTLEIEFNSGGVYQYFNVSESVFNALMSAPSHGKYFHSHINKKYSYNKIR